MAEKKKARRPRSKRKPQERGPELPEVTLETTGSSRGEGGQLVDPHIRAKCRTIREYIEAGVFSAEQADAMLKAMGSIVANGNNREKIAAYRTILARAKMEYDIEQAQEPKRPSIHQHGHIHINADAIGADLAAAAADLGIQITVEEDLPGPRDSVPGEQGRSQQEE